MTSHTTTSTPSPFITSDPVKVFLNGNILHTPDWQHYWSLGPEIDSIPRKEIQRQSLLHELITTEGGFLHQVQVVHYLYYYRLILDSSTMVSRGSNQEFAEKTFSFHQRIYDLHKTFLYDPLLKRQEAEGPWITNFPDIFQRWLSEATPIYLEFCALYPRLHSAIKIEATKSSYFQRFLNQTRDHRFGNRLGWDTYMKSPIVRIQRYPMLFAHSLRYSERTDERHGYQAIEKVILDLQDLVRKCGVEIERAEKEVRMERLREQINSTLKDGIISPHANILFDEDLLYQKRGFGRVTQLRVVVLGPGDYSMVLILSKISKLTQINDDTDSYELVEQVSQSLEWFTYSSTYQLKHNANGL